MWFRGIELIAVCVKSEEIEIFIYRQSPVENQPVKPQSR